jgi:glutathione S-transferase
MSVPRVSRAVTHRRGGLQTPDERFAGCTLFGWLASPYTAKVRALLSYKGIPFTDATPSALQLLARIKPSVGRLIMPTVRLGNGEWRQDSAVICDEIESQHPQPITKPSGAAQQLASLMIELHADEWLPMLALHHRWNDAENAAWATREFGRCAFPLLPAAISARLVAPFASKMQSFRTVQGVQSEATRAGAERYSTTLISALEGHFGAASHAFLLGDRPCRGDFSLYGPLWAHLYRDPHSREALFGGAPNVVRWMERLHGHATDPAFPNLPCRRHDATPGDTISGAFLASDEVPATLDPLFRGLFAEHWPFLAQLVHALDAHLDGAAAEAKTARGSATAAATSEPPLPLHVPRALEYGAFTVGGARGERRRLGYTAWRLQRPLSFYRSLELAPSRSMELASVTKWLDRLEVLEAFRAVRPRWRIERESELPLRQEVLSATRAQV